MPAQTLTSDTCALPLRNTRWSQTSLCCRVQKRLEGYRRRVQSWFENQLCRWQCVAEIEVSALEYSSVCRVLYCTIGTYRSREGERECSAVCSVLHCAIGTSSLQLNSIAVRCCAAPHTLLMTLIYPALYYTIGTSSLQHYYPVCFTLLHYTP